MGSRQQSLRGDPVIYRSNTDDSTDMVEGPDDLNALWVARNGTGNEFTYGGGDQWSSYYDADNDGIYSARDAVILDVNQNDVFNEGTDVLTIGSNGYIEGVPNGAPLTRFTNYSNDSTFEQAYYWVDLQPTPEP